VSENRALRKTFGHKREELAEVWGNCLLRNFVLSYCNLLDEIKEV